MTISERKVVSIHYKVADAVSAEVIDSSDGEDPMIYLHGAQNIIPGLEQALEGKVVGDEFVVTVESADAYGDFSEDRIRMSLAAVIVGVEASATVIWLIAAAAPFMLNS